MGDEIEILERAGYLETRYLGRYDLARYKLQMELSVRACQDHHLDLLLVDLTSLLDFRPTLHERHEIGVAGANLSRKLSKVAVVGTAEQIPADQYATTVAQNRGLRIQAFRDRAKAVEWLIAPD
jgi:hypothetical protein